MDFIFRSFKKSELKSNNGAKAEVCDGIKTDCANEIEKKKNKIILKIGFKLRERFFYIFCWN